MISGNDVGNVDIYGAPDIGCLLAQPRGASLPAKMYIAKTPSKYPRSRGYLKVKKGNDFCRLLYFQEKFIKKKRNPILKSMLRESEYLETV